MTPTWEYIKTEGLSVAENNHISKNARRGDYLIKKCDKWECLIGYGYLSHCSRPGCGWLGWTTRKNAAWFSKEEAVEISGKWRGIKIVKR